MVNTWWNPYGQGQSMLGPTGGSMQQPVQQPMQNTPDYGPQAGAPWLKQPYLQNGQPQPGYQPPQQYALAGGPPPSTPSGTSTTYMQTQPNQQPNAATPQTQQQGQNVGYGTYKYGNANPNMNKFGLSFAMSNAGSNLGQYLYQIGYNPQQDTYRHMFDQGGAGHGHDENNWNRIYGWINAFAAANGFPDAGKMPADAMQKAANYAIGRLRTDMLNDDPSGRLWQQSGFAGADKYLAQGGAGGATGGTDTSGKVPVTGSGAVSGANVGGAGVGGYDWKTIKAAESDQKLGYDMLMQYMTGSNALGTGPFAGFMEQFFKPLATAMINARGAVNGQTPTNIDDMFAAIKNGGANGKNVYQYMGDLARQALAKQLGGGNVSFDDAANAAQLYAPLLTRGLNPIAQSQYQRQQQDALTGMQTPSYWDMAGQNHRDFGGQLLGTPFYRTWWQ